MGEAKHNILMFSQLQKMNHRFQGRQMMDAFNIIHFSDQQQSLNPILLRK